MRIDKSSFLAGAAFVTYLVVQSKVKRYFRENKSVKPQPQAS